MYKEKLILLYDTNQILIFSYYQPLKISMKSLGEIL